MLSKLNVTKAEANLTGQGNPKVAKSTVLSHIL
jgi:hypothetical protein